MNLFNFDENKQEKEKENQDIMIPYNDDKEPINNFE
jgi:hypothetical protein